MADLLSLLVHEARTPLTALRGSLGLLASESETASPAIREFSSISMRNVSRLVHLFDDLAAYIAFRDSACVVTPVPVDLSVILEEAAERVQPVAEERGVTVEAELAPFDATADETLLREAVARMAFYAVRVTPRDGVVRIGAETVGGQVVVRVTDQGRPLTEEFHTNMFEPFSSVARRGVDSADRAGLDLAIAKAIADLHHGIIEYRQMTGGGVVRLTLGVRD